MLESWPPYYFVATTIQPCIPTSPHPAWDRDEAGWSEAEACTLPTDAVHIKQLWKAGSRGLAAR